MKSKNVALMAVAIGCGLVAAFLTAKLSGGGGAKTVDVIVASKELPVGTVLDEKELETMIIVQKMPEGTVPPDIVNNPEELKNKKLNRTLKKGNYFAVNDVGADNGIKLPDGKMKYAIKTDGVKAVAGFVNPGDKVDILLTETTANGKAKSGVFLSDMLVLAVDTRAVRAEGGQAAAQVNSVSLAVTPEEALTLSSAERRGEVKLLLRDPKSTAKTSVRAQTKIKGIDDDEETATATTVPVKTVPVFVALAEVPANTKISSENFDKFFGAKDIREDDPVVGKLLKDRKEALGRYLTRTLDADMQVFNSWFSDTEPMPEVVKAPVEPFRIPDVTEVAPQLKEALVERSPYPRRFEQIINNQRVVFIETAPNEFRRVDNINEDVKGLPPSDGKPLRKEDKTEVLPGDRGV